MQAPATSKRAQAFIAAGTPIVASALAVGNGVAAPFEPNTNMLPSGSSANVLGEKRKAIQNQQQKANRKKGKRGGSFTKSHQQHRQDNGRHSISTQRPGEHTCVGDALYNLLHSMGRFKKNDKPLKLRESFKNIGGDTSADITMADADATADDVDPPATNEATRAVGGCADAQSSARQSGCLKGGKRSSHSTRKKQKHKEQWAAAADGYVALSRKAARGTLSLPSLLLLLTITHLFWK